MKKLFFFTSFATTLALSLPPASADAPPERFVLAGCRGTTVKDAVSRLEWQRATFLSAAAEGRTKLGLDAISACTSSTLEGGGWRLPTMSEMSTIEDTGRRGRKAAPYVDVRYFSDTKADYYATASHVGVAYWAYNFGKLDTTSGSLKDADPERLDPAASVPGRSVMMYVRCVRFAK